MTIRLIMTALASLAIVACGERDARNAGDVAADTGTRSARQAALDRAVEQGIGTLAAFQRIARAPRPGQTDFAVRAGFPHEKGMEHLWLSDPRFSGDTVVGIAQSNGVHLPIRKGQKLMVLTSTLTDWMYLENGKLQGGYTERALIEQLPSPQREQEKRKRGIE